VSGLARGPEQGRGGFARLAVDLSCSTGRADAKIGTGHDAEELAETRGTGRDRFLPRDFLCSGTSDSPKSSAGQSGAFSGPLRDPMGLAPVVHAVGKCTMPLACESRIVRPCPR